MVASINWGYVVLPLNQGEFNFNLTDFALMNYLHRVYPSYTSVNVLS
jgi:hypothetical protein